MSQLSKSSYNQAKILIVDDEPDNIELLSLIILARGYQVEKCDQAKTAVDLAKAFLPDLILLDICMPEIDGYEICLILKSEPVTQDIPIIFISSLREVEDKTQAFDFGGNDYITKPFDIEEVLARVENQLRNYYTHEDLKEKNQQLAEEVKISLAIETRLLKVNQKLSKLVTLDGLTNIANRRYFDDFLSREWRVAKREKYCLSLIMCDVDFFKHYNDYFGHQEGDTCLRLVAQAICQVVNRPADLAARYGGEEFAIILPRTNAKSALHVAEKISQQVKNICILHPESSVSESVSLSLGVTSVIPSSRYTKKQLQLTADQALYQAKKQGRDRVIFKQLETVKK